MTKPHRCTHSYPRGRRGRRDPRNRVGSLRVRRPLPSPVVEVAGSRCRIKRLSIGVRLLLRHRDRFTLEEMRRMSGPRSWNSTQSSFRRSSRWRSWDSRSRRRKCAQTSNVRSARSKNSKKETTKRKEPTSNSNSSRCRATTTENKGSTRRCETSSTRRSYPETSNWGMRTWGRGSSWRRRRILTKGWWDRLRRSSGRSRSRRWLGRRRKDAGWERCWRTMRGIKFSRRSRRSFKDRGTLNPRKSTQD